MARTIATLSIELEARMAKFESDLKRANRVAFKQSRKMQNSVQKAGKNMVRALGIGAGVALFTQGMRASVKAAVDFEKAMDEVSTLVGDTTDMDKLTESVRDMSRQFGKAPVEEAKALYQIISAGAETAAEQMTLLTASNKLAIGGVTDVATAADGLTTILNAYSLEADQATSISDLLFVGMKQGKTTIEEMAGSIGQVATIAAQTGVPINQLVAGVATLTKSGIGTAEAMSGLRGVLSAVLKQSPQSVAAAEKLGVAFNLQALEAKGLAGFLNDIQVAADGDAEKLQKLFGRVEGLTAVMSLGANGAKEFNSILEATGERAGATDEAFQKMSEGSAFQLDQLKVSITLLAESLGTKLLPFINTVAGAFVRMLKPVKTLVETTKSAATAATDLGNALRNNAGINEFTDAISESRKAIIALEVQINKQKAALILIEPTYHKGAVQVQKLKDAIKDLEAQQYTLQKGITAANKAIKREGVLTEIVVTAKRKYLKTTKTSAKETAKFKAEAEKLNSTFKNMQRELEPLVVLSDEFNQEVDRLVALLNTGRIDRDQFEEWLAQIETKFKDAQYAAAGLETELKEVVVTGKRVEEVEQAVSGMATVIENSFKRLDDTFAGFWSNMIKNGKISLKSIKDLFLDTIAQMLHAAITQPIVMRIGAALTGGLASGGAQAAGGLFGGVGGGGAPGGGLASIFGNFSSIFSGNHIQQAFANFSDIFSGGAANWQFGLAGIVGGILGDKIFGGQGGLGGSLGAAIGTAILPGIGSIIGGLLGGFIGGLFGSDTPTITAGGDLGASERARRNPFESDLGGFFIAGKGGVKEFRDQAAKSIQEFDAVIASFLNEGQLQQVTDALKGWSIDLEKEAITMENLLGSRFEVILGSFSQNIQDYVNGFSGLEDQTAALQRYVVALNTVGAVIAIFSDSNISEILSDTLANAAKTSTERLSMLGTAITDAFSGFDDTPEQLNQISQLIDARYRGELEYLAAVDQLVKGISQSIEAQQDKIRETVEGPQSFEEIFGEAQGLLSSLSGVGSPEEIAQIVATIQSLVDRAFGGLDEGGQIAQADTLIAFLGQVQAAAEERANLLAQQVIDEGQILRDQAILFAESISAPLDLAVQSTDAVNESINTQTQVIIDGNESNTTLLEELIALVRSGNDDGLTLRTGG